MAYPKSYLNILAATKEAGFTMPSDIQTGEILRTLAGAKGNGNFLELGTGTGLSTAWILEGMSANASLVTVDNDPVFMDIAKEHLGEDKRLSLVLMDGADWFQENESKKFDFIFADTWHGKYLLFGQAITMLQPNGIYVIDDMLPQPNWPEGHHLKAERLLADIQQRQDLQVTVLEWSTGLVIASKKP